MAVAALALYAAWLVFAFGVRTVVAVRRTGDSGWRGTTARPLTVEWWAAVLFVAALVVGVAAPVADLLGIAPLVEVRAVRHAGVAVAVAGIALTVGAQLSMGASWRIGVDESERTELVTDGAFAIARNPIYTAMLVTAAGLASMVPNALAATGSVALVVALELQVRHVEEPYLRSTHGEAYADYASRVGRFLPGVGRLPAR